jgi:hypothetical protein
MTASKDITTRKKRAMPFAQGDVTVSQTDPIHWKLIQPVVYVGKEQTFTVPAGFITDFASVPRIFYWLVPTYGAYTKAAILHDFLCEHPQVTSRDDADGIFRRTMRELGVPFLRRWMMWAAVRAGAHLKGATLGEFVIWLLVAVPSLVFLLIPGLVVLFWLVALWLIEAVTYLGLKPVSSKPVVAPKIWPGS